MHECSIQFMHEYTSIWYKYSIQLMHAYISIIYAWMQHSIHACICQHLICIHECSNQFVHGYKHLIYAWMKHSIHAWIYQHLIYALRHPSIYGWISASNICINTAFYLCMTIYQHLICVRCTTHICTCING